MENEQLIKEHDAVTQELVLVSELAPFGSHAQVADKVGISRNYCAQIRRGDNATTASVENITLKKAMVQEYRRLAVEFKRKMELAGM